MEATGSDVPAPIEDVSLTLFLNNINNLKNSINNLSYSNCNCNYLYF